MLTLMQGRGMCGRLYNNKRPYKTSDFTRKIVRAVALAVRNANHCGLSLVKIGVLNHWVALHSGIFISMENASLTLSNEIRIYSIYLSKEKMEC
jgi:hypothetical protein